MHGVQVSFIGTIVVASGRMGVWLGLVCVHFYLLRTISWTLGAPLLFCCNGSTSWPCSQGYLICSVVIM